MNGFAVLEKGSDSDVFVRINRNFRGKLLDYTLQGIYKCPDGQIDHFDPYETGYQEV
jgi:hypothetical protein